MEGGVEFVAGVFGRQGGVEEDVNTHLFHCIMARARSLGDIVLEGLAAV